MKIAIWGEGPIYEASLAVCRRHDIEIGDVDDCDVLLLANFPKIVGAKTRAKPRIGALCFHPSPLPKHRGRDSVYWTVKMGDKTCGVSWFWIDEGIDTGDVAAMVEIGRPNVRPRELYEMLLVPVGEMLLDILIVQFTHGDFPRFPQDQRLASYEPPRQQAGVS